MTRRTKKSKPSAPAQPQAGSAGRSRIWRIALLIISIIALLLLARPTAVNLIHHTAKRNLAESEAQRALGWLEWCERIASRNAETSLLRARAHRKLGDFDLARSSLTKAKELGIDPELAERETWLLAAQQGELHEAERHFNELLSDPAEDGRDVAEAFTIGFLANRRLSDASRVLKAWQADYPDDAQAHFLRGELYTQLDVAEVAEQEYSKAIQLKADHHQASLALAELLESRKRWDEALEHYCRCQSFADNDSKARVGTARCLRILGDLPAARETLRPLLKLNPLPRFVALELAWLEIETGEYHKALPILDSAADRYPRDLTIKYALATARSGAGEKHQAKADFEWLAEAETALGEAREQMSRADAEPKNAEIRSEIGTKLLRYGSEEEGIRWLRAALEIDPHLSSARQALLEHFRTP